MRKMARDRQHIEGSAEYLRGSLRLEASKFFLSSHIDHYLKWHIRTMRALICPYGT
jgi:hypothetical protein